MASGVRFRELCTWTPDDDNWVWGQILYHPSHRERPDRIAQYLNARTEREIIDVQPARRIVMVQTAVHDAPSGLQDRRPYQSRQAVWVGVLRSLGGAVD